MLIEHIAMPTKEDEISLVMESAYSPGMEFGCRWEESGKESSNSTAYMGIEVIDH